MTMTAERPPMQLRLDGLPPVPHPVKTVTMHDPPLSAAQKAILRHIAEHGSITAILAGGIVHRVTANADNNNSDLYRDPWAGKDGWSALNRMRARGLVVRAARGVWTTPDRATATE